MVNLTLAADRTIVEVITLSGLDKTLAYKVPLHFQNLLEIGSLVRIPVRHRQELAVVERFGTDQEIPIRKLKQVIEVVQPHPVLSSDLMQLFRWSRSYYSASAEAILETIIPAATRRGMQPKTRCYLSIQQMPTDKDWAMLKKRAPKQAALLQYIKQKSGPVVRSDVLKKLNTSGTVCDRLVEKGFLKDELIEEMRVAYDDELSR